MFSVSTGWRNMKEKIANLRLKFDGFMRNKENALILRKEAYLVLDEARRIGRNDVVDEVEDMLIDLESSIGENRCNCSRNCKC
jgi:hypothetical protein